MDLLSETLQRKKREILVVAEGKVGSLICTGDKRIRIVALQDLTLDFLLGGHYE